MNTFSNIFKKSFLEGFGGSDITTVRILVTLAVTCALALYIFIVYYVATKKTFYSKTFNIALFMIAVITSSIILAMQSNLGDLPRYGRCTFYCQIPDGDQRSDGSDLFILVDQYRYYLWRRNV